MLTGHNVKEKERKSKLQRIEISAWTDERVAMQPKTCLKDFVTYLIKPNPAAIEVDYQSLTGRIHPQSGFTEDSCFNEISNRYRLEIFITVAARLHCVAVKISHISTGIDLVGLVLSEDTDNIYPLPGIDWSKEIQKSVLNKEKEGEKKRIIIILAVCPEVSAFRIRLFNPNGIIYVKTRYQAISAIGFIVSHYTFDLLVRKKFIPCT